MNGLLDGEAYNVLFPRFRRANRAAEDEPCLGGTLAAVVPASAYVVCPLHDPVDEWTGVPGDVGDAWNTPCKGITQIGAGDGDITGGRDPKPGKMLEDGNA